jgi:hypothetical protein
MTFLRAVSEPHRQAGSKKNFHTNQQVAAPEGGLARGEQKAAR